MIGSRLLFSGYGVGFKGKPLHAGFLGQDTLLVHDEAHLEPAFQRLIEGIRAEQAISKPPDFYPMRVVALSATARKNTTPFELTAREKKPPARMPSEPTEPIHHVWHRLTAKKRLRFHSHKRDSVARAIGTIARDRWRASNKAVLIFVRTIEDVKTVRGELTRKRSDGPEDLRDGIPEDHIQVLTGTIRGLERDRMADPRRPDGCPVFARFLKPPNPNAPPGEQWKLEPMSGAVFLICTSAGKWGSIFLPTIWFAIYQRSTAWHSV